MKRHISLIIILLSVLLIGCSNEVIIEESDKEQSTSITENQLKEQKESIILEKDNSKLSQTFKITDKIYDVTKNNIIYSPISLDLALGLIELGATGNTEIALNNFLMNDNYHEYAKEYIKNNDYYEKNQFYSSAYKINNGIWLSNNLNWSQKYIDLTKEYFNANTVIKSFDNKDALSSEINNWVKEKTYDMIDEIIAPEIIEPDTSGIFVNTLYFESSWRDEWNIDKSAKPFINIDGSKSSTNMINTEIEKGFYYENKKAIAFKVYYSNGCSFIGILPKNKGEYTLSELNIEELLKTESREFKLNITMPSFTYESEQNLTEILELTYPNLMKELLKNADFSNMLEENETDITLDKILQKCRIELDEKGTKAAAVTIISTDGNESISIFEKKKTIELNRPFAYIILDKEDNISFIGKVDTIN